MEVGDTEEALEVAAMVEVVVVMEEVVAMAVVVAMVDEEGTEAVEAMVVIMAVEVMSVGALAVGVVATEWPVAVGAAMAWLVAWATA